MAVDDLAEAKKALAAEIEDRRDRCTRGLCLMDSKGNRLYQLGPYHGYPNHCAEIVTILALNVVLQEPELREPFLAAAEAN